MITSLDKSAKELLEIQRKHWGIAMVHWIMDVILNEDQCRLKSKNANSILNSMKKLGIFLHSTVLKQIKSSFSIRRHMQKCERDDEYLANMMEQLA